MAEVCPFKVNNPFISAQLPCKLTVADVNRIHLDRAVLQHTVGKAARRSADIHADAAAQ